MLIIEIFLIIRWIIRLSLYEIQRLRGWITLFILFWNWDFWMIFDKKRDLNISINYKILNLKYLSEY